MCQSEFPGSAAGQPAVLLDTLHSIREASTDIISTLAVQLCRHLQTVSNLQAVLLGDIPRDPQEKPTDLQREPQRDLKDTPSGGQGAGELSYLQRVGFILQVRP